MISLILENMFIRFADVLLWH